MDEMSLPKKAVTVSIVSHLQSALVLPLLRQLDQWSHGCIVCVVVTLNLPEAFEVDVLGLRFPVKVIANTRAMGFGENHNQAFASCSTPWFLVLNPDIVLQEDTLYRLLARAEPNVGLIAPRVIEPAPAGLTPERGVITPWEVLAGPLGLRRPPARPVWFPGMYMLFRSAAFAAVQGFDVRYHMYCEDFDICARLRLAGWTLKRSQQAEVLHPAQRHSHVRLRYLLWHVQSLWRTWTSGVLWRYWRLLRTQAKKQ